jgi:hypothetical protein
MIHDQKGTWIELNQESTARVDITKADELEL